MRHKRATDREHLLFAARKRAGNLTTALFENGEFLVHRPEPRLDFRFVAARIRAQHKVVLDRKFGKHAATFGHLRKPVRNDFMRVSFGEFVTRKHYRAACRGDKPVDRVHDRGFARAVRADKRNDFALENVERHALDRVDKSVIDVKVAHGQHRGSVLGFHFLIHIADIVFHITRLLNKP